MTDDILSKSLAVAQVARVVEPGAAEAMLATWLANDPDSYIQVTLALARVADVIALEKFTIDAATENEVLRGHAAYNRGERVPIIIALERRYQRERGRREYKPRQQLRLADGA